MNPLTIVQLLRILASVPADLPLGHKIGGSTYERGTVGDVIDDCTSALATLEREGLDRANVVAVVEQTEGGDDVDVRGVEIRSGSVYLLTDD